MTIIQRFISKARYGFIALMCHASITSIASYANTSPTLLEQRKIYQKAEQALLKGNIAEYKRLKPSLVSYPLYPHLELKSLQRRLKEGPVTEVHQFLNTYKNTLVANQLQEDWLKTIALQENWPVYLKEYPSTHKDNGEFRCYYHWAQYQTGKKKEALAATSELWAVGHSQPDACNPLFKVWREKHLLTTELAWKRFSLAMQKNNRTLARYLKRYLPKSKRQIADVYLNVHRAPQTLKNYQALKKDNPTSKAIVLHALQRLAGRNSKLAIELKAYYTKFHHFKAEESAALDKRLAISASQSYKEYAKSLLDVADPNYKDEKLLNWRLRVALKNKQWSEVEKIYARLPEQLREKPKWRYWRARSGEILNLQRQKPIDYSEEYREISKKRGFYSFLAAEIINDKHYLQHQSLDISSDTLLEVKQNPGIQSALEFFTLKRYSSARREWQYASRNFTPQQYKAAAIITREWGWHNQSINSMIAGGLWDDMDFRFPTAFREDIIGNAKRHGLDSSWVFAIARQESAFMFDARSPAGAMGLLQLMPSTAKQVARQQGISFRRKRDLINPQKNIRLGSAYLKQMLSRFEGNRVYATAAYNAGPNRVSRWLKERSGLPEDAWAETIPFSETRQYVQNVLTYAVIYGSHIGEYQSVLFRKLKTHPIQITRAKPLATMETKVSPSSKAP